MNDANDLRDRAERLRQQLPEWRTATPPAENGKRIGTIDRSDSEQIRVNWSEFEGKPFISIRMWKRSLDGSWWPDKRGIAIRVRELPGLAAAIAEALDIAEADVADRANSKRVGRGRRHQAARPGIRKRYLRRLCPGSKSLMSSRSNLGEPPDAAPDRSWQRADSATCL